MELAEKTWEWFVVAQAFFWGIGFAVVLLKMFLDWLVQENKDH